MVRIQKTHLHLVALLLKLESKHPHSVRTSSRFETVESHGHLANSRPRWEQKEAPVPFLTDRIYCGKKEQVLHLVRNLGAWYECNLASSS